MRTPARRDGTPDNGRGRRGHGAPRSNDSRTNEGRTGQGRSYEGRSSQGRPTEGRTGQGRPSQDRTSQDRTSWGRAPQSSSGRPSDGRRSEGRPSAGRSTAGQGRPDQPRSSDRRSSSDYPRGADRRSEGPRNEGPRSEGPRTGGPRSEGARGGFRSGPAQRGAESRGQGQGDRGSSNWRPPSTRPKPSRRAAPPISNARPAPEGAPLEGAALPDTATFSEDGVRLQKVLARAGVGSRRVCEQMIDQGRIEVNGKRVNVQGMRIDPATAVVKVDGMRVMITEDLVHLALNKPRGWQSTMQDEMNRPCVGDLVAERIAAGQRLFHVGRLDAETEGLLLLTNDGELAHRLMHPSYKVRKTYLANVEGMMSRATEREMRAGIELEDGPVEIDEITTVDMNEGSSLVKIVLHEGRKHIVRRLLEHVGHPVTELVRTQIGVVQLGEQRPGTMRVLNRQEVGNLYKEVGL